MGMNSKEALVYAAMTFLLVMVMLGGSGRVSAYPARMNGNGYKIPVYGEVASNPQVDGQPDLPLDQKIVPAVDPGEGESASTEPFTIKIRRGQSLSSILNRRGVKASEIMTLNRSLKGVYDIRDLKPGRTLRLWLNRTDTPRVAKLTYQIDAAHRLEVVSQQGTFHARKLAFTEQASAGQPMADTPLTDALPSSSALTIPDVLVPDWSERDAALNFLSSRPPNSVTTPSVHRRARQAVVHKKMFLKAPLRYRRISSGYSHSRKHPIYHVRRPHLGIDYAAPMGTSVRAVGQGTVVYVGWSGGFGRCVQIRHPHGYTTYYGHLSRFAKGMTVGKRISQGSVIGYVGSTGVATGAHLDFRVSHKGRFINPLALGKVKKPV